MKRWTNVSVELVPCSVETEDDSSIGGCSSCWGVGHCWGGVSEREPALYMSSVGAIGNTCHSPNAKAEQLCMIVMWL